MEGKEEGELWEGERGTMGREKGGEGTKPLSRHLEPNIFREGSLH